MVYMCSPSYNYSPKHVKLAISIFQLFRKYEIISSMISESAPRRTSLMPLLAPQKHFTNPNHSYYDIREHPRSFAAVLPSILEHSTNIPFIYLSSKYTIMDFSKKQFHRLRPRPTVIFPHWLHVFRRHFILARFFVARSLYSSLYAPLLIPPSRY
jgi:hypothetical protein